MKEATATINGVTLTEAQVQEAARQIAAAKEAHNIFTHGEVISLGSGGRYLVLDPTLVRESLERIQSAQASLGSSPRRVMFLVTDTGTLTRSGYTPHTKHGRIRGFVHSAP